MARVKGPNGLVLDFPDSVAEGLLVSDEYTRVEDEPKREKKPAPAKKAAASK